MKIQGKIKFFCCATLVLAFILGGAGDWALAQEGASASLSFSPASGTFVVESTFEVSVFLNTKGQSVNTIDLTINYPPDKLQLVSSSTGKSIIGIWTAVPRFDNTEGKVILVGGIPGGVNVSQGLITTLTFRARAVGSAVVRFASSRVLLNDGAGTEVLTQTQNSVYNLILPAPAGPIVSSVSHPDQSLWYSNASADLTWNTDITASGYSYILNDSPIDVPDNISEGERTSLGYDNLSDGRHYFHIKAFRDGQWGGVTHYAINVDTSPPAEFQIGISPSAKTTRKQPVIQFDTTDAYSGLDHFELKIVPLSSAAASADGPLFIEAQSPYIPAELGIGKYDVIVRAYDKAGNAREIIQRMTIVTAVFRFVADRGIEFRSSFIIPWFLIWIIIILLLIIAGMIAYRTHVWHRLIHHRHENKILPDHIESQIEELKKYRERYGKLAVALLFCISLGFGFVGQSYAQQGTADEEVLGPPVITTVSDSITNEEIFYIGGRAGFAEATVIIYLQNIQTTATLSEEVVTDKNGEWFYRGDTFLTPGDYLVWAQTRIGQQQSPPSSQIRLSVEASAIQIGATKLSYATIYLLLLILSLVLLGLLISYTIYRYRHGNRKHALLMKHITEAEASVRRGFAVLNRDLEAELELIKKAKRSKQLSEDERRKEEQILKDIKEIEQYLSKEIWEIEDTEVRA